MISVSISSLVFVSMSLTFLATPLTLGASLAVVTLTGWLSFLGWQKSGFLPRVGALELLRTAIVVMVAITFNQPEWLIHYQPQEKPTLLVLADESASMNTQDVSPETTGLETRTRAAWVDETLSAEALQGDDESLDILVERFSSQLEEPVKGTDLHGALATALRKHVNLRGIILLSDGDWNVGEPPAAVAGKLRVAGVPVYSMVAGSETKLPDIVLERFDAPTFGVVTKPMRLPFVVSSSLPHDVQTELRLETSTGEKLSKKITIPAMGTVEDAILWKPMTIADVQLAAHVPEQPGELVSDNNGRLVPISIREEAIRVLLIESFPRWEYRYLRNALERDPGVEVACLLFHPELTKVGGGRGYIKLFPATLEELSRYDVVLLGDVGIEEGQLSIEQVRLLKGLVRSQASGLILMPGMRGGHYSLLNSELEELYPVVLDQAQIRGWGSREAAQFELTESGRRSLLTKLEDNEDENARLWEILPGFHWYAAAVRSKAGTEVLATHKTEIGPQGRVPLLVTKTFGTGKVLYMGTDAAWRWRKGVEDKYHYRFWGQVARWMAYQRGIAQGERMRLFYAPDRPLNNTVVTLNANVMSSTGEPLQTGHVTVQAVAPSGKSQSIRLQGSGDEWGLFSGSFSPREPGEYRMVLSCRENNSTLETNLAVQGLEREQLGQPARVDVLEEISQVTRGKLVKRNELGDLIKEIRDLPEPEPLIRRLRLWCHPIWASALVLLLGIFWSGRKMVGQL